MTLKTIQTDGHKTPFEQVQEGDVFVRIVPNTGQLYKVLELKREVPIEPFVPDPAVWRARTDADRLTGRHIIAAKGPNVDEFFTYYVRKDED